MHAVSPQQTSNELVERGIRLPPQPEVLIRLEQLLACENYNGRTVAAALSQDAGLAAMLFKVARSALLCGSRPPDSLEQVILRLGFQQVLNLARAVALSTSISDSNRAAFQMFWKRSRELALLSSLVAKERVSVCNVFPDQAFMAGIFLECGVPVLMQRFPDYCATLVLSRPFDLPSLREEDARFNVDHCNIGYLVARHWKLPDFIALAILHQYELPCDKLAAVRTLLAIIHLARHAYHDINATANPAWAAMGDEVLQELGLAPEALPDYLLDLNERFRQGIS
jgi:HD-like signal output (HDOD) protein